MNRADGRVVMATGASGGIGRATAVLLAETGPIHDLVLPNEFKHLDDVVGF